MAKDKDIIEVSILIFSKTLYVFIFDFHITCENINEWLKRYI